MVRDAPFLLVGKPFPGHFFLKIEGLPFPTGFFLARDRLRAALSPLALFFLKAAGSLARRSPLRTAKGSPARFSFFPEGAVGHRTSFPLFFFVAHPLDPPSSS